VHQLRLWNAGLRDYRGNSALMLVFVIGCVPSLLSLSLIDAEAGSNTFCLVWALLGLLNAALYASVRAHLAPLKKAG